MDKNVICKGCGAAASVTESLCRYCRRPLLSSRELSRDERLRLEGVVRAMESTLQEAESSSWAQWTAFLFLASASVISYFLYDALTASTIATVLLTLFTGLALFVLFGGIITITNERIYRKKYDTEVKARIDSYLISTGGNRYEFDHVADDILPAKARLRQFLFRVEPPPLKNK